MHKFYLFLPLLLLCACSPKKPTVAQMRAEQRVQDSIDYLRQVRTLQYTDSLLLLLQPTIDPMLKNFVYDKDERYEDHGTYTHRYLRTTTNTSRCFLQASMTDDCRLVLRSFYFGANPIRHTAVMLFADSAQVRLQGDNHIFESEGYHEILTLEGDDALSVLRFINAYADSRLKIQLFNDKNDLPKATYYLADGDRKALIDTYALYVLMSDIRLLEKENRQASLQVQKYQKRLQK